MDFSSSKQQTAELLICYAATQGCEAAALRNQYNVFVSHKRWVEFWQSGDTIGYHLAGEISDVPRELAGSRSSFRGVWDEAGSLADIHQAFALLRSWLIDAKQVDELPSRTIHRSLM